eukprot:TRINITY_DN3299_c0_g5_i1.p1 TRINITY_DN3299_c0_g5~~TRINITY_DN3299_c0_g5_i1.p1  ORF type:complete len:174 (-),score=41.56 TRINITY_DN3299_c0_g5_i1:44-565(-)
MPKSKKGSRKRKRSCKVYDEEFEIEKILDKKIFRKQEFYKIKWKNYPEAESTWEPLENLLNVYDLVAQFESKQTQSDSHIDLSLPKSFTPGTRSPHETAPSQPPPNSGIGSLATDVPDKILSGRMSEKKIYCTIEWKARENGIRPLESEVVSTELREKYANLLLDFYESKAKA